MRQQTLPALTSPFYLSSPTTSLSLSSPESLQMRTLKAFTVVAALHLSFLFFLFSSSKDRSLRLHVDPSTLFSSTPPPSELVPVEALAMVDDSHEATRDREMQEIVQRFG